MCGQVVYVVLESCVMNAFKLRCLKRTKNILKTDVESVLKNMMAMSFTSDIFMLIYKRNVHVNVTLSIAYNLVWLCF